mmetsp:Transcript_24801/g.49351  ORF Transcript_24801/g.49351 Transcript_24801/m.49351 type:complete len:259 (-) Transcript_24801:59-835(-)
MMGVKQDSTSSGGTLSFTLLGSWMASSTWSAMASWLTFLPSSMTDSILGMKESLKILFVRTAAFFMVSCSDWSFTDITREMGEVTSERDLPADLRAEVQPSAKTPSSLPLGSTCPRLSPCASARHWPKFDALPSALFFCRKDTSRSESFGLLSCSDLRNSIFFLVVSTVTFLSEEMRRRVSGSSYPKRYRWSIVDLLYTLPSPLPPLQTATVQEPSSSPKGLGEPASAWYLPICLMRSEQRLWKRGESQTGPDTGPAA